MPPSLADVYTGASVAWSALLSRVSALHVGLALLSDEAGIFHSGNMDLRTNISITRGNLLQT